MLYLSTIPARRIRYLFNEILSRDGKRINPKGRSYSGVESDRGDEVLESGTAEFRKWSADQAKTVYDGVKLGLNVSGPTRVLGAVLDAAEIRYHLRTGNTDGVAASSAGVIFSVGMENLWRTGGEVWKRLSGAYGWAVEKLVPVILEKSRPSGS